MHQRSGSGWLTALVGLTGILAAVASAAGIFLRGDLATKSFVTVRGDTVEYLIGGAYRFNGINVASEGVGWDLVTLFVIVPALAFTLPSLRRGTLRATLLAAGFLVYFLYQYAEYAMALAYGPLFPVYVAIIGLSAVGTRCSCRASMLRPSPSPLRAALPAPRHGRLRAVHGDPARGHVASIDRVDIHGNVRTAALRRHDPGRPGVRPWLPGAGWAIHCGDGLSAAADRPPAVGRGHRQGRVVALESLRCWWSSGSPRTSRNCRRS